jgi:thymidylate synthase
VIRNFEFTNVNYALPALANLLMSDGDEFGSDKGRTNELMHVGITLDWPTAREIVLPSRKANVAAQIVETVWVLSGRNDIEDIQPYLPRAADFSDDGLTWRAGYGPRLREYGEWGVDQLEYVVETLRRSPGSRQAVVSLWDPRVDTMPGKDIACNNWLSFSSRLGQLDLHVAVRSNDLVWGWSGINVFEWSSLLEIVAGLTGLMVGKLHFSITSLHIYERHWAKGYDMANDHVRDLFKDSPKFDSAVGLGVQGLDHLLARWWECEKDIREGYTVDVNDFPEPMLRSWLRVIQWYWSGGDFKHLEPLEDTRLHEACRVGMQPTTPEGFAVPAQPEPPDLSFLEMVNKLHTEKHAAYGDSWKRRGEWGILANIARKVDRLQVGGDTSDETQVDTAVDLLVYLAKYRVWLEEGEGNPDEVAAVLAQYEGCSAFNHLFEDFEHLALLKATDQKIYTTSTMIEQAYTLARELWSSK